MVIKKKQEMAITKYEYALTRVAYVAIEENDEWNLH
jgi:hypothetical protein